MSDNFSLIIKNGSCYINGDLVKTDLGLSGKKIKKIGKMKSFGLSVFSCISFLDQDSFLFLLSRRLGYLPVIIFNFTFKLRQM